MTGATTPLSVLVTEPIMARFEDELTRGGRSPHHWRFIFDPAAITGEAPNADVLVCSSASAELLAEMPRLRLLHVTGAGTDRVALEALAADALVANTFRHGRAIAEHVMMVSMMLLRGALRSDADMRAGLWRNAIVEPEYPFGGQLDGRTLGVVGFGSIGSSVARLGAALGMKVRTVRRNPDASLPAGVDVDWVGTPGQLHEMLAGSDIVVVTVPLEASTRGLVDRDALAAMKPSAILVNVARGPVVDEEALHAALVSRTIAGAAIDVWWRSPRDPDTPPPSHLDFTSLDNVVLTPHQSGHTHEVFAGRARDIADNVDAIAEGRPLRNVVPH